MTKEKQTDIHTNSKQKQCRLMRNSSKNRNLVITVSDLLRTILPGTLLFLQLQQHLAKAVFVSLKFQSADLLKIRDGQSVNQGPCNMGLLGLMAILGCKKIPIYIGHSYELSCQNSYTLLYILQIIHKLIYLISEFSCYIS